MSLRTRLRHVERKLATGATTDGWQRFADTGEWPTHPRALENVRYWLRIRDQIEMSLFVHPAVGREVYRRHLERQATVDRWIEEGTPYDRDALPSLRSLDPELEAKLLAEVREWIERYRATGELPDDEELRRDVVDTVEYEGRMGP